MQHCGTLKAPRYEYIYDLPPDSKHFFREQAKFRPVRLPTRLTGSHIRFKVCSKELD